MQEFLNSDLGIFLVIVVQCLVVAVAVSALWPSGSADEFIEFELAAVNGEPISAEFRFEVDGDQTTFFMRSDGLEATRYDVWVRTEGDGERHWIGRLDGDPDGTVSFVADFSPEEIERFWVTDPEDEPVLGHDID